jgi:hypothetical protein
MAIPIRYGDIAMMGQQTGIQPKIFYPHLNLEQRVPRTHLLRRIQEKKGTSVLRQLGEEARAPAVDKKDSVPSSGKGKMGQPIECIVMETLLFFAVCVNQNGYFIFDVRRSAEQTGYFVFSWEDKYLMIDFLYFSKSLKSR